MEVAIVVIGWFEMEDRDWLIGPVILFDVDRLLIGTENLLVRIVTVSVGERVYLHNLMTH